MSASEPHGPDALLAEMQAKLGRPLRVLHIGNIANNAYNNARIQRQYGIEADVLCYDYYHVMGCPEWEDGQFEGDVEADFPDWFATTLKGCSRPEWFVQGPAELCLQYLRARQLGLVVIERLLWNYLAAVYWRILQDRAIVQKRTRPPMPRKLKLVAWVVEAMGLHASLDQGDHARLSMSPELASMPAPRPAPADQLSFLHTFKNIRDVVRRELWLRKAARRGDLHVMPARRSMTDIRIFFQSRLFDAAIMPAVRARRHDAIPMRLWMRWRGVRGKPVLTEAELGILAAKPVQARRDPPPRRRPLARLTDVGASLAWAVARSIAGTVRRYLSNEGQHINHMLASIKPPEAFAARYSQFLHRRNIMLTDVEGLPDQIQQHVRVYSDHHPLRFFDVMTGYDVVQGYSIDGFIPYMNGIERFASYEHGTIRDLPWEPSMVGVICARVYRESPIVFVTNSDVLPSVDRLGLPLERVVHLPHAFDDAKLRRFREQNRDLQPPGGPAVFFSPTRHHWKDKSGSWTKGNDILLRAAALVAAEGLDFRLVLVEWGNEVPDSKALIAELGIADKVSWMPMLQKRGLWEAYCTAHAVVDQFTLPALGGVGFETLTLGRRLITAIDEAQLSTFFGEAPPCLSASSVEECARRMRQVIADPLDAAGVGMAGALWMEERHSARRIVALQAQAYAKLLAHRGHEDAGGAHES